MIDTTIAPSRPPFVLCFAADQQGCAYHRIMTPLASMVESGAVDGRIDMVIWPDEIGIAAKPDVVVWQRQVEDAQVEVMRRWRVMLPDALFVYELDDFLDGIPAASFHASFMPPDIAERVRLAVAVCDRVTTTTEPLAEWFRSLGAPDVRVVPNGLPQGRLRPREARPVGTRLRIGFAGGISHGGDLEIIRPAMEAIGDDVIWVFMGMQPEDPPVRVEFHEGQPVLNYLDAMAKLDLDLMLAPLEDNPFNRCKSNLRLVEAGAIGASVIAQKLPPYYVDVPPVFAYADTPDEWTKAIRSFIRAKPSERKRNADALTSWVGRKYTLERILPKRIDAWVPQDARFKPSPAKDPAGATVVVTLEDDTVLKRLPFLSQLNLFSNLEDACRLAISTGSDVLWLRPASTLTKAGWAALQAAAEQATDIASVVPLASDGPNGFPVVDRWSPVPVDTVHLLDDLARDIFGEGRRLSVTAPSGPVVLLTRHALSMLGVPDTAQCDGNEEQAILDWGARAAGRQWKHMQVADAFAASMAPPAAPSQKAALRLQARGFANWLSAPSDSLTVLEREKLELALIRSQWAGPRPGGMGFGNDYQAWSQLHAVQMTKNAAHVTDGNVTIGRFGDVGLPQSADWIVFADDDVELHHAAQTWLDSAVVEADDPSVCVVYADHESVVGTTRMPEFKPDFDGELLLAQDYITQVCAVRADLIGDQVPADRAELYSLILKIAAERGGKVFCHVPFILGSIKIDPSPEGQALDVMARQVAIQSLYGDAVTVEAHRGVPGCLRVVRDWKTSRDDIPLVSIIVPTLGSGRLIQPCVATILQHTRYPNFEIIVVQNGARKTPELSGVATTDPRVRVVYWEGKKFNWSTINNWAIHTHAKGEFILTLNDDVCCAEKSWLDAMMGQVVQPDVGAVGARLLHPMGMLQHVGVVCHYGIAGHMHKGVQNGQQGHLGRAILTHEASAVTGACMLFSRSNFDRVGGFDESFSHNYNDTAFCLQLRSHGLRNVVEMTAELLHPEGTSRPQGTSIEGMKLLIDEGKKIAELCSGVDPYWSPNLAIALMHGGLAIQGLNAEALAWEDFKPQSGSERLLLINDRPGLEGLALPVLEGGDIPLAADLSGFGLRLTAPNTMNVRPWDVRDPKAFGEALKALGIDRVVLRSLVGKDGAAPPVEALRCMKQLGVPVTVEPTEHKVLDPWEDPAWREGDAPFGSVDVTAWRNALTALKDTTPSMAEAAQ